MSLFLSCTLMSNGIDKKMLKLFAETKALLCLPVESAVLSPGRRALKTRTAFFRVFPDNSLISSSPLIDAITQSATNTAAQTYPHHVHFDTMSFHHGGNPARGTKSRLSRQKLRITALGRAIFLLPLLFVTDLGHAAMYFDIVADQSTILGGLDSGGATISCGGYDYPLVTKNDVGTPSQPGNVLYPAFNTVWHYPGQDQSFQFVEDPYTGTGTPGEKMMINLVVGNAQSWGVTWGQAKALGFAMMLGPDFQPPTSDLMLCEWWQGSPYGPPLEMIIPAGTTRWAIGISNADNSSYSWLNGNNLAVGEWYREFDQVTDAEVEKLLTASRERLREDPASAEPVHIA